MENTFNETEKPQFFSDKEIFTKIWTKPREVLRFIHDNKYNKYVTILLVLAAISRAFDRAILKDMGDSFSLLEIVLASIFIGGLVGWLSFYIYSSLISWTGKWLKGKADTTAILRVLAYSMVPYILVLFIVIPQIGIYGHEIFRSDGEISSGGLASNILYYGTMIVKIILVIFTMIFVVVGISEVQSFGIGKAILNFLLPSFVIFIPLSFIVFIFMDLVT